MEKDWKNPNFLKFPVCYVLKKSPNLHIIILSIAFQQLNLFSPNFHCSQLPETMRRVVTDYYN